MGNPALDIGGQAWSMSPASRREHQELVAKLIRSFGSS